MADLHTKVSGVCPPQQDQILLFLHMFSPKSTCVGGWHPFQQGLAPPQWEILDPPLYKCLIIVHIAHYRHAYVYTWQYLNANQQQYVKL